MSDAYLGVVAGVDDRRDGTDDIVVLQVHQSYPGRRASLLRDALDRGPLDHAADADEDEFLVLTDDEGADEAALLRGRADRLDAFGAALRFAVLGDRRALSVAVVRHDEEVRVVARNVHRDHASAGADVHSPHAGRVAAHRAHLGCREADGESGVGDDDDLVVLVDGPHR